MKMGKRWFVGLALLLLLGFAVVGCSSSDSSTEDTPDATNTNETEEAPPATEGEEVSLEIFQFKVEFKDQFEALAKTYEEENPNVNINITTVGGGQDYGVALRAKFASGDEPDIYNVGGPQDVEDWIDSLADLSDTESASLALDGTLEGVSRDGQILGLPYNQEGYGLIYNKRVFEEAGIDPSSITTLASLEEAVKTLDEKKEELGLDAVFALPAAETWVTGLHLSNAFIAPEFNNDVIAAFEASQLEFKYSDAMKKVLDLQNDYSVQPVVSLDYSRQVEELFSLERVALIQQGNWVYNSIADMDPELAQDGIGILPIPVEGFKEDAIPVGVPMYWAVNKNSDDAKIAAAKEFLDWLYTSEIGKQTVVEDFKFIPAYEGYDSSKISDPLAKEIYQYAQEGRTIGWTFMGYPSSWGQDVLGVAIQKYLSDGQSWDDLVEEVKTAWEEAR
ncbi:ABC transporter substrate-binding protein [Alkalihalobacterium bogoriense]|uniref:ABC transporter substrate-binding protein n=1 Tax=Alkalihalobacterium bogoriense TaxID=246272 RepID=UPI00047CDB6C|nr:ABC transporter substrate-binding protein [Alkalihalobacterium bogoriense]